MLQTEMNGQLYMHCGANMASRDQIAQAPMPERRGRFHTIRPFIDDIELIEDALNAHGLVNRNEGFALLSDANGTAQRFFGVMEVSKHERLVEGELLDEDFALMVGLRGSYDSSLGRGIAVGSRVFVCDNLAFSGEVDIRTKQTTNIHKRIPAMLADAAARIPQIAEMQSIRFDRYKETELTPRGGDAAITEMVRRGILNPSQTGRVIAEWDEPSHQHHAHGHTAWRLMNAVTEGIKPAAHKDEEGRDLVPERPALPQAWARTVPMTKFLDEISGITF